MNRIDIFPEYKTTGISRKELLKIMEEMHLTYWYCSKDDFPINDLMPNYISVLEKLDTYIKNTTYRDNPCAEEHTIKVYILSKRQLYLSDLIFEYIVDDVYNKLPAIYHEIYDYIYDYDNYRDDFNYAELVLLQKIVTLLLRKLKTKLSNQ